jgi:hypothetical protein
MTEVIDCGSGLAEFPSVLSPGRITVGEYGAQFIDKHGNSVENPPDARDLTSKILAYHRVDGNNVTTPILPYKIPSIRTMDFGSEALLLQRDEGLLKGIWDA